MSARRRRTRTKKERPGSQWLGIGALVVAVVLGVVIGFVRQQNSWVSASSRGAGPSEELRAFQSEERLWGFRDRQGKVVIQPAYEQVQEAHEGFFAVRSGGKWGYIDSTGKTVIQSQFDETWGIFGGVASGVMNGEFAYVDREGRVLWRTTRNGLGATGSSWGLSWYQDGGVAQQRSRSEEVAGRYGMEYTHRRVLASDSARIAYLDRYDREQRDRYLATMDRAFRENTAAAARDGRTVDPLSVAIMANLNRFLSEYAGRYPLNN